MHYALISGQPVGVEKCALPNQKEHYIYLTIKICDKIL